MFIFLIKYKNTKIIYVEEINYVFLIYNNMKWIKEYRKFIKEGKSINDIIDLIGIGDDNKFVSSISDKIYEIIYSPKTTKQITIEEESEIFPNNLNYIIKIYTDSNTEYIIDIIYMCDKIGPFPNRNLYNISFTTSNQRNLKDYKKYETPTNLNEQSELIQRFIYLLNRQYNILKDIEKKNPIFCLGETENKTKIKWYRNLIKDSLDFKEVVGESSYNNGKLMYYFYK